MKKALILRLSSLGDVILTSVVIDPLLEKGYKPHLLTYKPFGDVFADDDRLEVIQVKREELFSKDVTERLKSEEFDLKIDLHGKLKTWILRKRLGGNWLVYKKHSLLRRLSIKIKPLARKIKPVTELYLEPLKKIGANGKPLPYIKVSEDRVKRLKEKYKLGEYIAICVGARYKKKMYPYYGKVAEILKSNGFNIVFVGDEKDRKIAESMTGINLCGELSIVDTMAVIKGALLFIGNDSGLTHGARAVKTKAVQIFGGTHPSLGFSLYPEEGKVVCKNIPCQPCDVHGKGECNRNYECMEIDPLLIVKTAENLINDL